MGQKNPPADVTGKVALPEKLLMIGAIQTIPKIAFTGLSGLI